jgi:hypothetical protein
MQTTTMTNTTTTTMTAKLQARNGLRVSRWLARAARRPEPRGAMAAVQATSAALSRDDEAQAGWHASSMDLAAGLQVIEIERGEGEEMMRRHFGFHHAHHPKTVSLAAMR